MYKRQGGWSCGVPTLTRFGVHEHHGPLAQLGEHLLCKQGVIGSIPISSTKLIHCFPIVAS